MKKYILAVFITFGLSTFVNAYEIGDYVCTNEQYYKMYESGKCGYITAISRPVGNPTDVLTLDTGDDISTYWIDRHKRKSDCKCNLGPRDHWIEILKLHDELMSKLPSMPIYRQKKGGTGGTEK